MATGRTASRWLRVYGNGRDLSGYARTIGPLTSTFDEVDATVMGDSAKGYLPGAYTQTVGELVGVFDNTATTGLHALANGANSVWDMLIAIGIRAAPAIGDPAFVGKYQQMSYQASDDGGLVVANCKFAGWDTSDLGSYVYRKGWGVMLHPMEAVTDPNSDDNTAVNNGAATAAGGFLIYQINSITGSGTVTISIEDSANGTAWAALSGATSGAIATASAPCAGIVQLGPTADVRQYLRWQYAEGGSATASTFALAFVRG